MLDRRESKHRLCRGKKNGKMRNCTSERSLKKNKTQSCSNGFHLCQRRVREMRKGKKIKKEKGVEKEKHKRMRVPASAGVNV